MDGVKAATGNAAGSTGQDIYNQFGVFVRRKHLAKQRFSLPQKIYVWEIDYLNNRNRDGIFVAGEACSYPS